MEENYTGVMERENSKDSIRGKGIAGIAPMELPKVTPKKLRRTLSSNSRGSGKGVMQRQERSGSTKGDTSVRKNKSTAWCRNSICEDGSASKGSNAKVLIVPTFLSADESDKFCELISSDGITFVRELERTLELGQRRGKDLLEILKSCAGATEWSSGTWPFKSNVKNMRGWTAMARSGHKRLNECISKMQKPHAQLKPGFEPRNASCVIATASLLLGQVNGFALAVSGAIDAEALSNDAEAARLCENIEKVCGADYDEQLFKILIMKETGKSRFAELSEPLRVMLTSDDKGAVLPLGKPNHLSMENAMFMVGLHSGVCFFASGVTSTEKKSNKLGLKRGRSEESPAPITKKGKRTTLVVEDNGVKITPVKSTKAEKAKASSRKGRKNNVDDDIEVSSVEEEEEEDNEVSDDLSVKQRKKENKREKERKKKGKSEKEGQQKDKKTSSTTKETIASSNCISSVKTKGSRSLTAATQRNTPVNPALKIQCPVSASFVARLHDTYGRRVVDKFLHVPLRGPDVAAGLGFAQVFAHLREITPRDWKGKPMKLPDLPVLPKDPGYTERSLKWWGVKKCPLSPLPSNDSSDSEHEPPF